MTSVLITFEPSFLTRDLPRECTVHRLSRFPFMDLERLDKNDTLIIALLDLDSIRSLTADEIAFLKMQIQGISTTRAVVIIVMPPLTPGILVWQPGQIRALGVLSDLPNIKLLDGLTLCTLLDNQPLYSSQLRFLTECSYSKEYLRLISEWIEKLISFHGNRQKKLLIVDLDNTLWGGVLAEVGWQGLQLDPEDPYGRAYLALQAELERAIQNGYAIAACSRNYPQDVQGALARLDRMKLKKDNFALVQASWESKDRQIEHICATLNLLEKDIIFIDDDPHERDLIRKTHPNIFVPDLPHSPFERPLFLRRILGIENPFLTTEDRTRTQSYLHNRQRQEVRDNYDDFSTWIASLDAALTALPFTAEISERLTQLLNRTNQFNLRPEPITRMTLERRAQGGLYRLYGIHYCDRLGDDGIIALIGFEILESCLVIKDFLVSCRVFGRGIEDSMIQWVINEAKTHKMDQVQIQVVETGRNRVAMEFVKRIGLIQSSENYIWHVTPEQLRLTPSLVVSARS